MASKAFKIIYGVELGKPNMLPKGRNSVRGNNGMRGRGKSKKQTSICNELNKGLKLTLILKDADLLYGVFSCE